MKNRSWREIEDSRDRRLWITQVGLPIAGGALLWFSDRERREWTIAAVSNARDNFVAKVKSLMNQ